VAIRYVKSGAAGAADGTTWADAYTTLGAAITAASVGDTVYVSHQHAEVGASGTHLVYTISGTAASPIPVICVNDGAEPPTARAATATITIPGGNGAVQINGFAYVHGIKFTASGNGAIALCTTTNPGALFLSQCHFQLGSSSLVNIGSAGNNTDDIIVSWLDCVMSSVNRRGIGVSQRFKWEGGSFDPTSSNFPDALIEARGGDPGVVDIVGVDLSALTSSTSSALVDVSAAGFNEINIRACKLGSGVAFTTGTCPGQGGTRVMLVNCDSADTNYRFARFWYQGSEVHETTVVRTGGASDGTTAIARKIVTLSTPLIFAPYESMPVEFWNETVGSAITATIECVTDNVTLTDAEAWLEVEYLGTSGFPLGLLASDRVADSIFGTPANQTSSSETWATTGLTTPVKQKLSVTFTPQEKGIVRCRVCVAKASTTVYYCPKVEVS